MEDSDSEDDDIFNMGKAKRQKVVTLDNAPMWGETVDVTTGKKPKKLSFEQKVEGLITFMKENGVGEKQAMYELYHEGGCKDSYLGGMLHSWHCDKLIGKAVEHLRSGEKCKDVWEWWPASPTEGKHLVPDCYEILKDWCDEQRVEIVTFVMAMYVVLFKKDEKRNAMSMIGASNAGKSVWFESMLPEDKNLVGYASKNPSFMWQDCVDKRVIMMEECMVTPDLKETFKVLAGGQEATVDIKNKPPAKVQRTPMLIASNNPLHKYFPSEKQAIQNRVMEFSGLIKSEVLDGDMVKIDKFMWTLCMKWAAKQNWRYLLDEGISTEQFAGDLEKAVMEGYLSSIPENQEGWPN